MVLTGPEAYDQLKKAHELIRQVNEANIVDCPDDYLLLISSRANSAKIESGEVSQKYDKLWRKSYTKRLIDARVWL